jgi:ribonucleoside-diphosphate reductase alpha chain
MLMLNDDHPDIEEFITVKKNLTRINHANLSVCVSDRFMEAVKNDAPWNLVWQGEVRKTLRARDLWNLICESAWASGEPGLVFIDRYNKESNTWYFEKIISVNPCGEQGLPEWGVCNLGAMNLAAYVRGGEGDAPGVFDYEALAADTRVAMRFLDNVVDATEYFYPENAAAQLGTRRTGLGTMGLGDALIKLHVPYGSDASLAVIEQIYRTIRDAAYDCAADLAAEKEPFPNFDRERYLQGRFIQRLPEAIQHKIAAHGIRNAVLLTQAPTGTTSLLAGVSSGIEPVYDFAMVRRDRTGEHVLYHPLLQAWKDAHPAAGLDEKPRWFVAANDLTPEEHVRVQAMVQRFTDSSISKTVNAPNSHTVEQVQELYLKAYDYGCKGVTYFRDGCREGVLSHLAPPAAPPAQSAAAPAAAETGGGQATAADEVAAEAVQLGLNIADVAAAPEPGHHLKPRPRAAEGITYRMPTPLGTMFTTVTRNGSGQPFEVFMQVGKAGSDTAAVTEALGRLISLILRLPSPLTPAERLQEVVDQLAGIGGGRQLGFGRHRVRSLPDAVAQVLAEFLGGMEVANAAAQAGFDPIPPAPEAAEAAEAGGAPGFAAPAANGTLRPMKADLCPECGDAALVYQEGCAHCHSCGYSEC